MNEYLENIFNVWSILAVLFITGILMYAYREKKIDGSAIGATALVGLLCLFSGGIKWVIPLIVFFVIGNLVSHHKKAVKKERGVEQEIRTWKNVVSNGGAAAIFALFYIFIPNPVYFLGLMGAMACALADTSATELGQVYGKNPRLIYNLKKAKIGTSGAISIEGLIFALVGSGIISSFLLFLGYPIAIFIICLLAGFLGCIVDSLLGCTLEKWGYIDTHSINLLTTYLAGVFVLLQCVC